MKKVQVLYNKFGRLFRNNVGNAWQGIPKEFNRYGVVEVEEGDVLLKKARRIKFGLGVGMHDLIGWTKRKITADMVGKVIAVFTSAEIKTKIGKVSIEQKNFQETVRLHGGISAVVRELGEVEKIAKEDYGH